MKQRCLSPYHTRRRIGSLNRVCTRLFLLCGKKKTRSFVFVPRMSEQPQISPRSSGWQAAGYHQRYPMGLALKLDTKQQLPSSSNAAVEALRQEVRPPTSFLRFPTLCLSMTLAHIAFLEFTPPQYEMKIVAVRAEEKAKYEAQLEGVRLPNTTLLPRYSIRCSRRSRTPSKRCTTSAWRRRCSVVSLSLVKHPLRMRPRLPILSSVSLAIAPRHALLFAATHASPG